ncbi:Uncharacterized protein SCF082_LOCUS53058 [Durusdinium trenchii]|uniref:Tubulin-specific chaperone A n=1 Tax=Durusdinium trenchii TaxID=1381693 RepID=A0ABP0SQA2_9DINO
MHGKSAASKRFQSATAAVQGRGVSNKWQKAQKLAPLSQKVTPSIKTLVPELLESAGPKITVAARRSIFTHARAYLSNQHRTAEPVKMLLVKSVVAGTRVHNKQDLAVTNLKENVVEKQEERRRIQLEQEAQEAQEEEQAYHDGASTLANTGCLFDQVIKLERLAQLCKEDSVLIQKAVSSAQKCVRLLEDLKMATHEDDELLRVVQEAEPAQISSRLLQDLQSEIAAMREILNLAQEAAQEASPRNTEVLDLVGNICEEPVNY